MKSICYIPFYLVLLLSCKSPAAKQDTIGTNILSKSEIRTHKFDSCRPDEFIKNLAKFHARDYISQDSSEYITFCNQNNLLTSDTSNFFTFYEIKISHDILTSQGAINGSTGNVLNVPYFWHWTSPNPRHTIQSLKYKKTLNQIKPPTGFGKYATYADIDRTPGLFWSEFFSPEPLYFHASCDTFNTFGWCSEREMAFVCLMEILGYKGEIIVSGNHSWSEVTCQFNTTEQTTKSVVLRVDNTFNSISWGKDSLSTTMGPTTKWYNEKASSTEEKTKVLSIIISPSVSSTIESKLIHWMKAD